MQLHGIVEHKYVQTALKWLKSDTFILIGRVCLTASLLFELYYL